MAHVDPLPDEPSHPDFRPDIQGLRAIAILVVVACHAGLPGFAGGFVGVDMFFVISGFLITGVLFRQALTDGKIHLVRFYSRRCKRLVPALLVVTGLTLLLARVVLSPRELALQANAGLYVPLWLSNFYFSFSELDYFGEEAATNPFLHTWSLGVEEQFYLLWPFMFMGLVAQGVRSANGIKGTLPDLRTGLLYVLGASFLLCVIASYWAPMLAFYMMPTRGWQFALGALVFLVLQSSDEEARGKWRGLLLSGKYDALSGVAGLLLIALSVLLLDDSLTYPGFYASVPSVGTALLLFAGARAAEGPASRLLASTGLRWIGDISYSWYLWHWPILILGALVFAPGAYGLQAILILVSLILAVLTYFTVEAPFRNSVLLTRKPVLTIWASVAAMVCIASAVTGLGLRARGDAVDPAQAPYLAARNNRPVFYDTPDCDEWYRAARVFACTFGSPDAQHKAVLVGDSIGVQWFGALARPLVEAGWQVVVYTKSSCPIVDEPLFYARIKQIYENCALWREGLAASIARRAPDLIFVGSATDYAFSEEQWREGTRRALASIAPLAPEVFLIRGTPIMPFDGPDCLARKAWQPAFMRDWNACAAPAHTDHDAAVLTGLQAAIEEYPNVRLLDLNSVVCPGDICAAERNGQIVYRDNLHLTDTYVSGTSTFVFEAMRAVADPALPSPWKDLPVAAAASRAP